jgi:hypothetical protein
MHLASNAYTWEIRCRSKPEFILNLSTLGWVAILMLHQPCARWKKPVSFESEKVVSITSFHEVDNKYFDIPLLNVQEKNLWPPSGNSTFYTTVKFLSNSNISVVYSLDCGLEHRLNICKFFVVLLGSTTRIPGYCAILGHDQILLNLLFANKKSLGQNGRS